MEYLDALTPTYCSACGTLLTPKQELFFENNRYGSYLAHIDCAINSAD